jgi:hypothetical protein
MKLSIHKTQVTSTSVQLGKAEIKDTCNVSTLVSKCSVNIQQILLNQC